MSDSQHRGENLFAFIATILFILGAAICIHWHISGPILPFDDAFITFKYSENAATGHGWMYNPGEKVFGTSTPLYTIWLTAIRMWTEVKPHIIAVRQNWLFMVLTAAVIALILLQTGLPKLVAVICAAAFMLHRDMVDISLGGMEAMLFSVLVLTCIYLLVNGQNRLGSFVAGLASITRPEGVMLAALVFLVLLIRWIARSRDGLETNIPSRLDFVLIWAPLIAWMIFAKLYYGTAIPQSITAKASPLYPLPPGFALKQMAGWIESWTMAPVHTLLNHTISIQTIIILAAGFVGCFMPRLKSTAAPWCALGFLVLSSSYALGNPLLAEWYKPVLFALWVCMIAAGVPSLLATIFRYRLEKSEQLAFYGGIILIIFILGLSVYRPYLRDPRNFGPSIAENAVRLRIIGYRDAANWLNTELVKSHFPETVLTPEIGALGFYFKGTIIDGCGLVSPEITPFIPVPEDQRFSPSLGSISEEMVFNTKPDAVVTLSCFSGHSLADSYEFNRTYHLVHRIPLPKPVWKGSDEVLIYFKRLFLEN